jgi:hypothetical protein
MAQMLNQGALRVQNETAFGRGTTLAVACFTLMLLFAMAGMATFLVRIRSTRWARISDEHGYYWSPSFW